MNKLIKAMLIFQEALKLKFSSERGNFNAKFKSTGFFWSIKAKNYDFLSSLGFMVKDYDSWTKAQTIDSRWIKIFCPKLIKNCPLKNEKPPVLGNRYAVGGWRKRQKFWWFCLLYSILKNGASTMTIKPKSIWILKNNYKGLLKMTIWQVET